MSGLARAAVLLLLATAAALLPHAMLQDWTGTEGRRVQIALEMARNGDWLVPMLFGEPTWAKPPLHYWLLGACAKLFGDGYLSLRLPSMLLVWLASVLAFALHRRVFGSAAAWVAALGVVTAPIVVAEFASAEIDPLFASFTAASLWCLAFGAARNDARALVAAGVLGGLSLLEKGPPYFLFAGGALLVWWRHRGLRGSLPFLLPLVLVPLCYYAPLFALRAEAQGIKDVAGEETVGRLFTWQWKHVVDTPAFWLRAMAVQAPLVFWCFWEWRSKRDARMGPEDLMLRMCSGAAVGAVLVLTFFPGKPTRYLLPNLPLFTFAVAPAVAHYATRCTQIAGFGRGVLRVFGVFGALLLVAVPFVPAPLPLRTPAFALALAFAPWLVRRPRDLVVGCLALPVLAGWTVLADFRDRWEIGPRARAPHGVALRAELDRLGAAPDAIAGFGHVHGGLLLGADLLPVGDEPARRVPQAPWLIREDDREPPLPARVGYKERLRLCVPGEVFVVEERQQK